MLCIWKADQNLMYPGSKFDIFQTTEQSVDFLWQCFSNAHINSSVDQSLSEVMPILVDKTQRK